MWKPVHHVAALATIGAAVIAALAYWVPRQMPSAAERREQAGQVTTEDTAPAARELRQALSAASAIASSWERDLALQHVVRAALTAWREPIAIDAADSIASSNTRDEVLNYIVDLTITRERFADARRAANLIASSRAHDEALRRVAETLNSRHYKRSH
jgi:hypothetical protein